MTVNDDDEMSDGPPGLVTESDEDNGKYQKRQSSAWLDRLEKLCKPATLLVVQRVCAQTRKETRKRSKIGRSHAEQSGTGPSAQGAGSRDFIKDDTAGTRRSGQETCDQGQKGRDQRGWPRKVEERSNGKSSGSAPCNLEAHRPENDNSIGIKGYERRDSPTDQGELANFPGPDLQHRKVQGHGDEVHHGQCGEGRPRVYGMGHEAEVLTPPVEPASDVGLLVLHGRSDEAAGAARADSERGMGGDPKAEVSATAEEAAGKGVPDPHGGIRGRDLRLCPEAEDRTPSGSKDGGGFRRSELSYELDGARREEEGIHKGAPLKSKSEERSKAVKEKLLRLEVKNQRFLETISSIEPPTVEWSEARHVRADCSVNNTLEPREFQNLLLLAATATPNLRKTVENLTDKPNKRKPMHFAMIEFCCEEDSEIGNICDEMNIPCLRITKLNPGTHPETIQLCLDFIRYHKNVHLHGSVPCTAWSMIQFLNIHMHGERFLKTLRKARMQSLLLIAAFLQIARANKRAGGTTSFEWPKTATGWKQGIVEQMIEEVGMSTAVTDGCSVGVTSHKTGEPMLKQWRFETDCETLREKLAKQVCSGDHKHYPCEGSETKRSGKYPRKLAKIIVKSSYEGMLRKQQEKEQQAMLAQEHEETSEVLTELIGVATEEETRAYAELNSSDRKKLLDAARKVHVNTGHKPPADLARMLRKQGAPPASRAAMELVKCSTCVEHKRPDASPVVALGRESVPFKYIAWDIKEVQDRRTGTKHKYLLIMDEASRFARACKILTVEKGKFRNVTTAEVLECFESQWEEIFGLPSEIRHDPEGAFVSNELITQFSQKGVLLKPVAGEAHWQNGLVERAIQTIFSAATRILSESDTSITRAVSQAVTAHNHLSVVHGFTPAQWAVGRAPSWQNLLHEEGEDTVNISRDSHEAFARKMHEQISARKIWQEEDVKRKLQRAQRARLRKDRMFVPGELVYAWRLGMNTMPGTARSQGIHKGAWYGPATVLGTETRTENGQTTPGNIVWIIISDRLWRCAPQQLRRASEREHAQHVLTQDRPWTFEGITGSLVVGQYRNIVDEPHPVDEDESDAIPIHADDAEMPPGIPEGEAELPAPKRRIIEQETENSNVRRRIIGKQPDPNEAIRLAEECANFCDTSLIADEHLTDMVCEIDFPFIEGDRAVRKYLKNPEAFVVSALKKRKVEIREKNLTSDERELIKTAKGKEVKEFIKEHVVERLKAGDIIPKDKVMRMRWILTWKIQADGERKGKARLVVLGFEDPFLGLETTNSPTLNKRSKQILLQTCVQRDWRLQKGDVTAAFLQGNQTSHQKYALAPPELAEAMNLPKGERVIRLLKSVYGLTTAPYEWFQKVNAVLHELGAETCHTDPCMWRYTKNGKLLGLVGAHVDDFLICGDNSEEWLHFVKVLLTAFRWTPWEEGKFKQCGVLMTQQPDNSIVQDQTEYLATLTEIDMKNERKEQLNSPVTEGERTQLRALLGALQWLVTQTRVDCAVDVNLLQSCVATATVETLLSANKILRKLRQGPGELFTRKIPENEEINLVAWSDASWANRRDGKSTGGFVIGLCGDGVLQGKRGHVTVISWGTNKLKRVAKSSMSAELQALANAEDELHLCRLCWAELNGHDIDLNEVDKIVRTIPGTVIIDAKSIYDVLTSQNQPLQLAEKRSALELLAYLKNTEANSTTTRWVHGGANLADGLTKLGAHPMLREFLQTSTWSLVHDPAQQAGKKRQAKGLDKLQNESAINAVDAENNFKKLAWTKLEAAWPEYCQETDSE